MKGKASGDYFATMLLYVAVGSALGGVCRYVLGGWMLRAWGTGFPAGTLLINVTGSLLLGLLLANRAGSGAAGPVARALLGVGFCGGYTTFSAFSYETAALLESGQWTRAAGYVGISVALSLLATFAGFALARQGC